MVRVLHIVTYMGMGGLETMIMNYYRKIDRNQVQFDFLVHRQERYNYDDEIEEMGGRIFRVKKLNPFSVSYRRELDDFFKTHREYKIVHCHLDCMSALPLSIAKKNGIPVRIAHCHSNNQDKNMKYFLKVLYKKQIRNKANILWACSKEAGKWTFETDEFDILPNAIDAEKYIYNEDIRRDMRKELKIGDALVLGHIGRFSEPKNHLFLIDVFKEVNKNIPNSYLVLVGDGEKRKYIEQKVIELGLSEKVLFLGVRVDVDRILQAFDVFVLPSLYEGLGIVAIEAQSSGLPCLISDMVSDECMITDHIWKVPLYSDALCWYEKIQEYSNLYVRKNEYNNIKKSGYDIIDNAMQLQKFYIRANNGEERCRF